MLEDARLYADFPEFLDTYARFLGWKDDVGIDQKLSGMTTEIRSSATFFSGYIFRALMHEKIQPELRQYLVV